MQVRTVSTPRSSVEFKFILLKGFQVISFKIKVYFITFLYASIPLFSFNNEVLQFGQLHRLHTMQSN